MTRLRQARSLHRSLAVIVLLCLLGAAFGTSRGWAESGRKGPEVDDMGDLEAAIDDGGAAAAAPPQAAPPAKEAPLGQTKGADATADPDEESLRDLERAIENDANRSTAQAAAPATPAGEDSVLQLEAESPGRRSASAPADAPATSTDLGSDPLFAPEPVGSTGPALTEAPLSGPAPKNKVTNLEFKMLGPDSRLTLTSMRALVYREVRNPAMKQVVYYFENTETPERLQRAYDASEFPTPVALFTLLQVRGQKPPASKLIIQLREDKVPKVTAHERGLYIDFPPPSVGAPNIAAADSATRDSLKDDGEENIYSGKQTYTGRRIRKLEVKNSDIQDVLRLIAKSSNYNIVVGDDVTGKVGTLSLDNVPWDQAFALVLQSKKLGYVRTGNVLRVSTLETLKAEKDAAVDAEKSRVKVEPLRTVLIPISYAKAADLAARGKPFLTDGRGSIETDTRTNTVVVKDIDRVVKRIQKLFAALDTQPPRVSIAAKFVEMGTDFSRRIGATIALRPNFSGLQFDLSSPFSPGSGATTQLTAAQFADLSAAISLSESENEVKTLANPSVTVVANQQATVTRSFSFFVQDQQATGGGVLTQLRQVTTNLTLDVTPQVTGDGAIFLNLNIQNEIPKGQGNNTTIDTRTVKTQILLDNGDTAVVGGVFSSQLQKQLSGVPLLMRIPIIGSFFSDRQTIDNKSEVFIFITARITNVEEAFRRTF